MFFVQYWNQLGYILVPGPTHASIDVSNCKFWTFRWGKYSVILPQDYDTKFHKKPRLVLEDLSMYYLFIFIFMCIFSTFLLCLQCNERSITLYIPILCFSINRNESLLFLCVFLSNRGGDTSIFLNISETGDTMGKIWGHGGKNCKKWPKKPNK